MKPAANLLDADLFVKESATSDLFDMTRALKDGEYTATVDGQNGPMTVKTTITEGKIAKVEVTEHQETAGIGDLAFNAIPDAITAANNPSVDAVSGATLSSNRIMNAVALCLEQAAE